ncbi:hypothetical protein KAJ61_01780 [Candidatus Parcubacteria bacterium]|nr:hypothetical protein [Candidatus Parcubacteria bacterium]
MKKVIIFSLMFVMTFAMSGLTALATVQTQLIPQANSDSTDPIRVKAKWEMLNLVSGDPGVGEQGEDDSTVAGAQFLPPTAGWGANMNYTVCAIVHGPEKNIDNIDRVITEIYYPDAPMHTSGHSFGGPTCNDSSIGISNDDGIEIDNPSGGCGAKIEQNFLHKLTQIDGKNLVCEAIRKGGNDNLIVWGANEGYEEVCNDTDGQLTKGYAAVYCADKDLIWEDPAGDYKVDVFAFDKSNNQSAVFTNYFEYIEMMGFQIDFNTVNYGDVKISEHKRVYGDKCYWPGDSNVPTVRNTGNVRLNMKVAQDDMGLGYQTDSTTWNVEYDARVGDLETDWAYYDPFGLKGTTPGCGDYTTLEEILDLSEIEEMDYSIHVVEKFPGNLTSYSGTMWLSAVKADFEVCE